MRMKSITVHWTAGGHTPTLREKQRYHYLVGGDGTLYRGRFRPEDNIPDPAIGHLVDGYYAAHCGGGNAYNIGISLCGMQGYRHPKALGPFPITRVSFERACRLAAQLCRHHRIPVDPDHVLTHMEFGLRHRNTASYGKIDIACLPWEPHLPPHGVGDYLRNKVRWYMTRDRHGGEGS